ncbi:MAG: hypothetical protein ACTSP4_16570, partial [Candidatus Hodarchaeales archaeon]
PTILNSLITSPYTNQTGERGEPIVIEANVTDTGYAHFDSVVAAVYLHYKLNKTDAEEQPRLAMDLVSGNSTWGTYRYSIPSSFVNHEAIAHNLTYYIEAIDSVGNTTYNPSQDNGTIIQVADHYAPDFAHTPVESAYEMSNVLISATVTDKEEPASHVYCYYRTTNDTIFTSELGDWQMIELVNDTVDDLFENVIPYTSVTLDGFDYFMNATDIYGNTRYDGTPEYPYHVNVIDVTAPIVTHARRSSVPANEDLVLTAVVDDNDPAFWYNTSIHNGTVDLFYRLSASGSYISLSMIYHSGADPYWEGIIEGGNFTYPGYGVDYYIKATDGTGNTGYSGGSTTAHHVDILPAGTPSVDVFSEITISQDTLQDDTIEFTIKNVGTANGTITHINFTVYNTTCPNLKEIWINGSELWSGTAGNGSSIELSTAYILQEGYIAEMKFVFDGQVANRIVSSCYYDFNFTISYSSGTETRYDVERVDVTKGYELSYMDGTAIWYDTRRFDFYLQRTGANVPTFVKLHVTWDNTAANLTRFRVTKLAIMWTSPDGISGVGVPSDTWVSLTEYYTFNPTTEQFRLVWNSNVQGGEPFTVTLETIDGYLILIDPMTPV